MNKVNLLPDWYLTQQKQKRLLVWRLALLSLVALAMLGWTASEQTRVAALELQDQALIATPDPGATHLQPLQAQRESQIRFLLNQQLAYHDVGNTIPMSAVIQQVINNLTPGMALSRSAIDVRSEPYKNSNETAGSGTPTVKFHEVAHYVFVGVAPNDLVIAQLIDRLQKNPLMADLTLNYTRSEILREASVRRFEIHLSIDLERLSTPPSPLDKKLAEGPHAP